MPLAPLNFSLYRLPNEVGSLLAIVKNGVDAFKRALREARRGLLVVDLFSAHSKNIDDITNCYKGYFRRYLLLCSPEYLISSKASERSKQMTRQDILEILNGSPDGPLRFLRRINSNQQMFAGNHNCRCALLDAGMISVVEQNGRWWRLAVTEKGIEALEVAQ